MPITQLSYHICDFIVDPTGRLYVLEFGDAFFNSSFEGRERFGRKNVKQEIIKHAKTFGKVQQKTSPYRNEKHARERMRHFNFDAYILNSDPAEEGLTVIQILQDIPSNYNMQYIQERTAQQKSQSQTDKPVVVMNGVNDMTFLLNRDKRILNAFLSLNELSEFKPRSWAYDCNPANKPFEIPEGITHFIIKHTNATMTDGMAVVPREDLPLVLKAIATRNLTELPVEKRALYENEINYYCKYARHQNLLIQEVCDSKTVPVPDNAGEIKQHKATARVVFAVTESNGIIQLEIMDMFWNLALLPVTEILTSQNVISAAHQKPEFDYCPSLSSAEHAGIEPKIKNILFTIFNAAQRMDVNSYLLDLYVQNQIEEIKYFLRFYPHVRINRLSRDLISVMTKVDAKLAEDFLLGQAKHYLMGHHLQYLQNEALEKWLFSQIALSNSAIRADVEKFIEKELRFMNELQSKNVNPVLPRIKVKLKAGNETQSSKSIDDEKADNGELPKLEYQRNLAPVFSFFNRKILAIITDYAPETKEDTDSLRLK